MMDLGTLIQMIDKAPKTWEATPPTYKKLRESGSPVVASMITNDNSKLLVYKCGYAVYLRDGRNTVVSMSDFEDGYQFKSVVKYNRPDMRISRDILYESPWCIAVIMRGEDRMQNNYYNGTISAEVMEDVIEIQVPRSVIQTANDEMSAVELIIRNEELEIAAYAIGKLDSRPKDILMEFYIKGKPQKEIGERLKMTKQSISNSNRRSLNKVRKIMSKATLSMARAESAGGSGKKAKR